MKIICNKCKIEKNIDLMVKDKNKKHGVRKLCKECYNLYKRKTPLPLKVKEGYKQCLKCKKILKVEKFHTRYNKPWSYCIECERVMNRNKYKHKCLECGKVYRSGKKNSKMCRACYNAISGINGAKALQKLNQKGKNNPMFGIRRFGKNNPNYNEFKTDEKRDIERLIEGYGVWRKKVYERDNYTCFCCKKESNGDLNAHHLNAYNWDIKNRTNIDNGITLCVECHKFFHSIYGIKNTNISQFIEFCKTYYNMTIPW